MPLLCLHSLLPFQFSASFLLNSPSLHIPFSSTMTDISLAFQHSLEILFPSRGEMAASMAAALFVLLFLRYLSPHSSSSHTVSPLDPSQPLHGLPDSGRESSVGYVIKLSLQSARNLIGANLNGTSDPYAIITCGSQKRFSSLIQGSRNPTWGEDFDFFVEELPAEIKLSIYDWDIIRSSTMLGSLNVDVEKEGLMPDDCYPLTTSGQVYLRINTTRASASFYARRRFLVDKPVATEVRTKPGPLQTIFSLPPDEEVENSYSCAMERSFLYHGRMYVSTSNICFHSNIFAKQMKVILPFEDVEEIKRSQHALINPAITIILRPGSGGRGVPPLASPDGRAKYKFASFWNRNHVLRGLQRAWNKFEDLQEEMKKERQQSDLRAHSSSFNENGAAIAALNADYELSNTNGEKGQPFIRDDVVVEILKDIPLSCTAEEFFKRFLSDESNLTARYRAERGDYDLKVEQWHTAQQYSGLLRKITLRSICSNPMCPPDTALTEFQHAVFTNHRKTLVLETVQQAHDVPFGSYFEIHGKWTFDTVADSSCKVDVKVGAHFNKWLPMQAKIKAGSVIECKKDADLIVKIIKEELQKKSENTSSATTLETDNRRETQLTREETPETN